MRYAIFSDVHANVEALKAVLEFYETANVDRYYCLGDTVGYGADPNACCDLVRKVSAKTVVGNHDAAVAARMDFSSYYDAARDAISWTMRELNEDNLAWLVGLDYVANEDDGIGLCHASPLDPPRFDYVFSVTQAEDLLPIYDALNHVTFIGHSHRTDSFSLGDNGADKLVGSGIEFTVEANRKYVVTVGSVGQPRDYNNRACCVIYDIDEQKISFHRVRYDIDGAAQKIFNSELSSSFGKRLYLGI